MIRYDHITSTMIASSDLVISLGWIFCPMYMYLDIREYMYMSIYVYLCMHTYMCIYIYVICEREAGSPVECKAYHRNLCPGACVSGLVSSGEQNC